jgi:hypothetical protein
MRHPNSGTYITKAGLSRFVIRISFPLLALAPCISPSLASNNAAAMAPGNVAVGNKLQTSTAVALKQPAPESGLEITLTSDDPSRVLLSRTPDAAGSASIRLAVRPHFRASPEFWVQALADTGSVTYTVTAPGLESSKGTVTLTPSAIAIVGPFRAPGFRTTPRAEPSRITLYAVRLDPSMKETEQQMIAGGLSAEVTVTSSNGDAGSVVPPVVTIAGGTANASVEFHPKAAGETRLAVVMPPGFKRPLEHAELTAVISPPGMMVTDQIRIGQNLQLGGLIGLGESGVNEVEVTLESEDPQRLLLSTSDSEPGSQTIKLKIASGSVNGRFFLQALGKSGTVRYTATATGYTSRTATIGLTPSGVVVTPSPYGPPDEAELFRKESTETPRGFVARLSKPEKMPLLVWTVQLDPVTLRSADVTVQPLRAGTSMEVMLKSSNPDVGSINAPVKIASGSDHVSLEFTPLSVGKTTITVLTPPGFTQSNNSTSVDVIVLE